MMAKRDISYDFIVVNTMDLLVQLEQIVQARFAVSKVALPPSNFDLLCPSAVRFAAMEVFSISDDVHC